MSATPTDIPPSDSIERKDSAEKVDPQDEKEKELFNERIARHYAYKSAFLEPEVARPPEPEVEQKTVDEEPDVKEGELSNELSDVTDAEEGARSYSTSYTLYRRIQPLVRDPRVRALAVINFLIALLCFAIFITTTVYFVKILSVNKMIAKISSREMPCLYQWSEWGPCSETCMATSRYPSRSRHVLKKTIIRARGRYPSCPENLETMIEQMPCNVYRCPVNLSSITQWTECFYNDPSKREDGGCYRMRDIPATNQLIYIDTTDVIQNCTCPEIMP